MPRPDLSRVPAFYHNYINHVQGDDLMPALRNETIEFVRFLKNIPSEKLDYRYAEGKWSIKEILQHIIDAERIFCYRSLRFARKDETPLPGFDENTYAANAKADTRNWNDLVEEFSAVRKATELLYASFDDEQLNAEGMSNNHSNYVLAFGFISVGHCIHHRKVIEERYLQNSLKFSI
ncbi:MAG: DinB family protein [Bacteroidota bacterium]|nr:DinB family protein [Bacteroidota bacterium]